MNEIVGCLIEPFDDKLAQAWLDWINGSQAEPVAITESAWLLAHCESGVTWGRLDGKHWLLGSDFFADLCPRPKPATILEARIFSPAEEILIWKTKSGLRGRRLKDGPSISSADPARPQDECRLLLAGQVIDPRNGFTRVGDGIGAEQALPLTVAQPPVPWPRLVVRHYFTRDSETGAVRVVVSRLVEIR